MSNSLDLQRLPCGEINFEKMIDGNLVTSKFVTLKVSESIL